MREQSRNDCKDPPGFFLLRFCCQQVQVQLPALLFIKTLLCVFASSASVVHLERFQACSRTSKQLHLQQNMVREREIPSGGGFSLSLGGPGQPRRFDEQVRRCVSEELQGGAGGRSSRIFGIPESKWLQVTIRSHLSELTDNGCV